jgi:putative lipoic acid-binding regulatory protein
MGLTEKARLRRNERQRNYAKETGYAAQKRYAEKSKGRYKSLAVTMKSEELEEIDSWCKEHEYTKAQLVRDGIKLVMESKK